THAHQPPQKYQDRYEAAVGQEAAAAEPDRFRADRPVEDRASAERSSRWLRWRPQMFGRRGLHLCLITDRPQHPVIAPVTAELSTRHRVRVIDPDSAGLHAVLQGELRDPANV